MRKGVAISISLPEKVAIWMEDYAEAKGMKRSHVVADALRLMQEMERRQEAVMKELSKK